MTDGIGLRAWCTYRELALILTVSPKRLQNLVSLHHLPRTHRWIGRGRDRRRIAQLPAATCQTLATLTGNSHLIAR